MKLRTLLIAASIALGAGVAGTASAQSLSVQIGPGYYDGYSGYSSYGGYGPSYGYAYAPPLYTYPSYNYAPAYAYSYGYVAPRYYAPSFGFSYQSRDRYDSRRYYGNDRRDGRREYRGHTPGTHGRR